MSRKTDIEALISLNGPAAELAKRVAAHAGDSKEPVALEPKQVASVVERFLAGTLSAKDVETWAAALNAREDIAAPNDKAGNLDMVVQELAKPGLTEAAAKKLAERLAALP